MMRLDAASPVPSGAPAPPTTPPNWDAIDRDVLCPLCEYNLRGLPDARCPECGYRFDWRELLEPDTRLQEYLFESRPERNVWSFFKTITSDLRPRRFWPTLSPTQRPNARRLVLYWFLAATPALAAIVANVAVINPAFGRFHAISSALRSFCLQLVTPTYFSSDPSTQCALTIWVLFACLAWPWLTCAALLVFQQSMTQARINRVHVLRCVVYSADVVFWIGWLSFAMLLNVYRRSAPIWHEWTAWLLPAVLGVIVWMSMRLHVAYRQYLRFDRPGATVIATQVIVTIAMLAVALWLTFNR